MSAACGSSNSKKRSLDEDNANNNPEEEEEQQRMSGIMKSLFGAGKKARTGEASTAAGAAPILANGIDSGRTTTNVIWPPETELTKEFLIKPVGIGSRVVEKAFQKLQEQEVDTVGTLLALYKSEDKLLSHGLSEASTATIWRFIEEQRKLSSTYSANVLQTIRFQSPTVLEDDRAILDLIETSEYHEIRGVLETMAGENYPTSQARTFQIGLVRGAMGVGKTFTTWKAATSIPGVIPCYFRMDSFIQDLVPLANELEKTKPRNLLAGVLAYVFSRAKIIRLDLELDEVISKIQSDLAIGTSKLILHIDEFQVTPSVAQKLVSGCTFTLIERFGIAVIPIVSGVSGVLDTEVSIKATNWREKAVNIRSLPRGALEQTAAGALEIPLDVVRALKNLQVMFNDCGDQAHLIVAVVRAIRTEDAVWKRLKSDRKFEDESAMVVFQKALGYIAGVYGHARWHGLVRAGWGSGDPTNRESWNLVTVTLIRKIVWLALSKTPFSENASLLDGDDEKVSLDQCRDAGMLSLEASVPKGSVIVTIPLLALVVMNQIGQLLPASIQLENPFGADWGTLERVAMACLIVQLHANAMEVPLQALRPGASLFAELEVTVEIPSRLELYYLGTNIDSDRLLRGKMAEGGVAELNVGDVMITATNQFAHDGIAILQGLVQGESNLILWFSQSKAVDGVNKRTGEKSASTLHDGSIQSTILPKMRKGAEEFKAKFPQFQDAFVVYDVFSDREPPKRVNGSFELESNEALFVTRSDTLSTVLGGFVARIREIVDK